MAWKAIGRRRWVGGGALLLALAMLIAGETLLKDSLGAVAFLFYWMVCFLLTGLAIVIAFIDARAVAQRTREEQRQLMQSTLNQIERQARDRQRRDT